MNLDLEVIGNRFEAALWFVVSFGLAASAIARLRRGAVVPAYLSLSAAAFALFGVSDVIESFTGAWWTPWWLLTLKTSCVVTFLFCFIAFRREKAVTMSLRQNSSETGQTPDASVT